MSLTGDFADRLAAAVEARKMSKRQLWRAYAARRGISEASAKSSVSKWFAGENVPRDSAVHDLEAILDVDLSAADPLIAELAAIREQLAAADAHRIEVGADLRAQLGAEIQQQLAEQQKLLTRLSALAAAMEESQTKLEADVAELRRLRPKRRPA